jgi:hypothetical protein
MCPSAVAVGRLKGARIMQINEMTIRGPLAEVAVTVTDETRDKEWGRAVGWTTVGEKTEWASGRVPSESGVGRRMDQAERIAVAIYGRDDRGRLVANPQQVADICKKVIDVIGVYR